MPSSLRLRGADEGVIEYFSPVKIIEVTFAKTVMGAVPKGAFAKEELGILTPEQFIFIFFMALVE